MAERLKSDLRAENLRCEYLAAPVGVDAARPRLSWCLSAPPEHDANRRQTAWQVTAGESAAAPDSLFDSGKVAGSQTNAVLYDGKPLRSHQRVFWRVRVWDENDAVSGWSETQCWSCGYLNGETIGGEWIGRPMPESSRQENRSYPAATYLRKEFVLARQPVRGVVYFSALGIFEGHLNGRRLGDEYFLPGWTDYRQRAYVQAYDVSEQLTAGCNVLGGIVADGWFRGNISNLGPGFYGWQTRLRAELVVFYPDGGTERIASDASWFVSTGPELEADMQHGETCDARLAMPGWDAPGFDARNWASAVTGSEVAPQLSAYAGAPVRVLAELPAVAVTEPKPGVKVFDFGQNFAGWARLKVSAAPGTQIELKFGEMLNADGTVYRENLRSARSCDVYICRGGGVEEWAPKFVYHGFRYVEVTGWPADGELTGIVAGSDLPSAGGFECSNGLINRIFLNTLWGQKSNYFELPTDCPQRDERMGWTGDTQIFVRTGSYNQETARLFNKYIVDLVDAQQPDGAFPNMAPAPYADWWSPGWGEAGVIVPWTMYEFYADRQFLRISYEAMKKHIRFCLDQSEDGIMPDEGFGDWLAIGEETPKSLIGTAYLARAADLTARSAAALDKPEEARQFRTLFERLRAAFQRRFVASDGTVGSDSQTSYLLAICFHLLTPEQRQAAGEHLLAALARNGNRLATGFLGVNVLLPGLTAIGATALAYRLLQSREFPSWGYSIDQGATTIWERWNSYTLENGFGPVEMNSFNHYAYGACVEWIYRVVLGIEPLEPGFGRVRLRPQPGPGVEWAAGHYRSLQGLIGVSWRNREGAFELNLTIPVNTTASVVLPGRAAEAEWNGRTVKIAGEPAGIEVGSGVHHFSRKW